MQKSLKSKRTDESKGQRLALLIGNAEYKANKELPETIKDVNDFGKVNSAPVLRFSH